MDTDTLLVIACAAAAGAMLLFYRRRRRRLRSVLFGALTGLAALLLVNGSGIYTGAYLPLNAFNVTGSALLGAPFVVFITVLRYL